jgi:hypothetical protein
MSAPPDPSAKHRSDWNRDRSGQLPGCLIERICELPQIRVERPQEPHRRVPAHPTLTTLHPANERRMRAKTLRELVHQERDQPNVRSVRTPAYAVRPNSANRPANRRVLFAPFRTAEALEPPVKGRSSQFFAPLRISGDGGNRTRVRDRVRMASTSVAGALISSLARLAGGVAGDQPP